MDKKIQLKKQKVVETVQPDGSTIASITAENVYPILDSDTVMMNNGHTLTEDLLNMNAEDYSEVITQDYHIDRVGGDQFKDQSKSGILSDMKLYGRTVVNEVGDHGTSPITTNGNDVFAPNEGMDEKVRVIDGQMDELTIKGNSTYNIMPDRTCCTDDVEVSGDNTKAFSFKDGLDSRIMLDTGLSDKMVLKGNTLTNIVRDPVGYASVHEVQDNIVPGSSENVRVLRNVALKDDYNGEIITETINEDSTGWKDLLKFNNNTTKALTDYTIIIDIIENNTSKIESSTLDTVLKVQFYNSGNLFSLFIRADSTPGRYVKTIKTNSEKNSSISVISIPGTAAGSTISFKNVMIIEGDCSDIAANLPYFKGTLSVNMENYDESRPKLVSGDCDRTKIYGQTLVDVLGSNRTELSKNFIINQDNPLDLDRRMKITLMENTIIKPNTDYIVRFKISNLNLDGENNIKLCIASEAANSTIIVAANNSHEVNVNSNGIYYFKARTISDFTNIYSSFTIKGYSNQWETSGSTARILTISEVSMYEYQEGMENWDLPYMVGEMRGTGLAKIESIVNGGEKELVDVLGETRLILSKTFVVNTISDRNMTPAYNVLSSLKPATDYIIRFKISNLNLDGAERIWLVIGAENNEQRVFTQQSLANADIGISTNGIYKFKLTTVDEFIDGVTSTYINIKGINNQWEDQADSKVRTMTISEFSLYEYTPDMDNMELPYMLGTKRIGYYGERKRTYTLPSGLELRSLPNGVRDEFDFESGILTRRVGEMTINGSEDQMKWLATDTEGYKTYTIEGDYIRFWSNCSHGNKTFAYISDRNLISAYSPQLPVLANDTYLANYNGRAIAMKLFTEGDHQFQIKLKTSDLETPNKAGLASYLATNNITFQYPMLNPEYIDYSKDILEDGEYKVGERINGFQDGYNPTTGKYIKRIETVTFNGSEAWDIRTEISPTTVNSNFFRFISTSTNARNVNTEINLKNNGGFKPITREHLRQSNLRCEGEFCAITEASNRIEFSINASKLFEPSVAGFKDYLSRNPITVSYVLADEVESNMTQEEFNALTNRANPKLHYFKDGSLKCTCLSGQPKGQLRINTPTSNYYDMQLIKPDTQYTVNNFSNMYIDGNKYQTSSVTPNQLTTPNTITSKKIVVNTSTDSIYPMMVEGVHDINDIRFFGMKSSTVLMNTRGKNLFNKDAIIKNKYQNYNTSTGVFSIINYSEDKGNGITEFIPIKPNTRYRRTGLGNGAYYDINKSPINSTSITNNDFTSPSNARYIVLNLTYTSDLSNSYIMEYSESDITYEPYAQPHEFKAFTKDENGVLQAVELNRIDDDSCDEIDLSTGIITRRVGKIKLDKIKDIGIADEKFHSNNNIRCEWNFIFDDSKLIPADIKVPISNILLNKNSNGGLPCIHFLQSVNNGQMRITFDKYNVPSARKEDIQNYLKEINFEIIYKLLEPYTEQAYIMIEGEIKTSLMLPNGVADGYNPITKVKTTRVGVKTYDGNYDGTYNFKSDFGNSVEITLVPPESNIISTDYNQFSYQLISYGYTSPISRFRLNSSLWLTLPKEKIGTNRATLLQYLKDNPITIYYQKAEETTETLDTFDISTVVNNFSLANKYGYKVENTNEIKLSKVIHHLPTSNMLYIPLLEANTTYITPKSCIIYFDNGSIDFTTNNGLKNTTPSTIGNKKVILNTKFNPINHSLIKYTGYTSNFSRIYPGYMRSDAISSSKNPVVKSYSKNILTDGYIPGIGDSIFTDVVKTDNNGEYHLECKCTGDIPSNKATWIFIRFNLDSDMLFKQYETINYSFKLKCNNLSYIEIKIVQPSVGGFSTTKGITSADIDEWTTFTGSLTINRTFRNSEITGNKIIFEVCGTLFFDGYDTPNRIVDTSKPIIIDIKDVIVTKNTDASKYEDFKEPSTSNFTIQKAVTMENGAIGNGENIEKDGDVRSIDYIKVIPGLLY